MVLLAYVADLRNNYDNYRVYESGDARFLAYLISGCDLEVDNAYNAYEMAIDAHVFREPSQWSSTPSFNVFWPKILLQDGWVLVTPVSQRPDKAELDI